MFVCKKGKVSLFNLTLFHYSRRDQSGADSVTSFWCRVWFGNIAWNWKVVFTTFFWLVRTLLQQNQTRLQKLSHNFWSRVWCCCAASVSTCAYCACLWIPETTAVDILSTHGAWWPLAWYVKFKNHNALKHGWEDQSMYIESREFCPFLEGGLATLGFIFSVISSSILKISVPMM